MKLDRVRAFQVTGPAELPEIEERSSRPLDVYPQVARQEGGPRASGAPLTQTYI